ncbi:MAG TPA: hypothetical protein VHW92_06740 [Mycobacteriales bacterium]|nr:hypothetical protein [Mycobacteriales bacterium]
MSVTDPGPDDPEVHRDRREHGGASARPDDDELARRTERERVAAGIDDYDPDDVPPATDVDPVVDPTDSEEYQEQEGILRRQESEGEIYPLTEKHPFPPTHYEE